MPTGAADCFSLLAMAASTAAALAAAGHAVIYKRDPRSATLWVLLIVLLPIGGSLLYLLFGINRYQRRARRLYPGAGRASPTPDCQKVPDTLPSAFTGLCQL